MQFPHLFSPVTINGMMLKNRVVMPPMGTGYGGTDGAVTDRLVAYLARRAQGGTGLIITEICAVDPRGRGLPTQIGIWKDDFIAGLSRIPRELHRYGAKVALQLHHAGRETFESVIGMKPEAPSAIPSAILGQPCEAMSLERITQMIECFAQAARRAREAGFDAVELHGAHGYLLNQFLSPFSNQRDDAYGGNEENRKRFILETIRAVRKSVGRNYPMWIRISADEMIRGGYDLSFMQRFAPQMVEAGVDAIHCSVGVYSTPGNLSVASMDTEPGFNLFRARAIKDVVKVPVIGVGRIRDPRLADEAIARLDADLISFGRQHLTDPDFVNKAREGALEDIRWCTACNQGCIERLSFEMKSATCSFNPECGREHTPLLKADAPKRVWVIGAGPAGLSAAMTAAERGHQVEVYEKEEQAGGQLIPASRPPHKASFMDWVTWALRRLKDLSVPIHVRSDIKIDDILRQKPDAVILACGAYPITPPIPGLDSERVFDARDVLLGKAPLKSPAVILGAGYVGMETADYLLDKKIEVTVLEMQTLPPVNSLSAHGYWLNKRLRKEGGRIFFGAKVVGVEKDQVIYRLPDGQTASEPASMVITAMGAAPENTLEEGLKKHHIPYRVVGDAKHPRRILEAIHEGYRAGGEI